VGTRRAQQEQPWKGDTHTGEPAEVSPFQGLGASSPCVPRAGALGCRSPPPTGQAGAAEKTLNR
jgi:hypothetical protein